MFHWTSTSLKDMVAFMQERAQNQRVELKLEADGEIPLIQADRRSVEEVFIIHQQCY